MEVLGQFKNPMTSSGFVRHNITAQSEIMLLV
jgi:hypothetical protein